jgi:hypothetical protein
VENSTAKLFENLSEQFWYFTLLINNDYVKDVKYNVVVEDKMFKPEALGKAAGKN